MKPNLLLSSLPSNALLVSSPDIQSEGIQGLQPRSFAREKHIFPRIFLRIGGSLSHKSIVQVILHTWSWCCCCSPRGTRVVKSTLFLSFSSSRVRSLLSSLEPEDHHRVNQRRKKFLEHHPLPLLLSSLIPSSLFSPQSVPSVFRRPLFSCSHLSSRRRRDPSSLFRLKKRGKKFFRQKEHTRRHSIQEDKWKLYLLQEERESPSDMNIGSSATSSAASAAYGTYYDPFYPNSGHSWSAYAAPPPGSNSSLSTSGPCGLLSSAGHKGLSGAHFTPVHQQRRKRRVLFTQAQVRVDSNAIQVTQRLFPC